MIHGFFRTWPREEHQQVYKKDTVMGDTARRVLVPLDGSAELEQILPFAIGRALRNSAVLGIVQVVSTEAGPHQTVPVDQMERDIEQRRDDAREYLEQVARRVRQHGVRATWEVRIGIPGEEIARAAETTSADLILIASRNYTADEPGDAPGVANATIRATDVPVIVIKIVDSEPVVEASH